MVIISNSTNKNNFFYKKKNITMVAMLSIYDKNHVQWKPQRSTGTFKNREAEEIKKLRGTAEKPEKR